MNEQELREKIEESAERVRIPDTLSPQNIQKKLEGKRKKIADERKRAWRYRTKMVSAAAVLAVCIVGSFVGYSQWRKRDTAQDAANADILQGEEFAGENAAGSGMDDVTQGNGGQNIAEETEGNAENKAIHKPKKNAGDLYTVAGDYGEVYDVLQNAYRDNLFFADGEMEEEAASGTAIVDLGSETELVYDANKENAMEDVSSHSTTNIQMEGVDESDIIKTDGAYIYTVAGDRILITDVRQGKMQEAGTIEVTMNSASDEVLEMYVSGNTLQLVVQKQKAALEKTEEAGSDTERNEEPQSNRKAGSSEEPVAHDIAVDDVYYLDTKMETELQTYDITDRRAPVKKGVVVQDGYYKTSRKIGNIVYLFTEKQMNRPMLTRDEAVIGEHAGGWIPLVNGKAVAADCIYIPQSGENGLLISSVDVDKPNKVVDNTLIVNNYVDVYVSREALYLYGRAYSGMEETTQLAKFSLKGGSVDAVGAASAKGSVTDAFAIAEYDGKLRLLTTDWSKGEPESALYLFDEKLQLTGKLENIAEGESIYAARYFGNTAYFVTYRNTDPLFAVDLTDERNPKILSELKITGFSEYLHFWGKDKLLGIGYETDPKSGIQKGIKLTMFDISNPADLKTLGSCVIKDVDTSPALYHYKCVLADAGENLIGFAAENYSAEKNQNSYLLFTWEDGDFKNLMTEKLSGGSMAEEYRGLYVGDRFYLADRERIISYDRKNDYRMLEKLEHER